MHDAGISKADWAMVFCTFPHRANYQEILKIVCQITKTKNVTGCSAIGVLSNHGEIEARPGVVVLAVSSSNIRSKRSHRERAIKRHIGRILPDLRGINQASGRENLIGFHKGKGTRRRIFHIIWSCNSVSCAYQNRL